MRVDYFGKRAQRRAMLMSVGASLALLLAAATQAQDAQPTVYSSAIRYDGAGRIVGTIAPDPDGAGPLRHAATRTSYNASGQKVKVETGELSAWQPTSVAPNAWPGFNILQIEDFAYDVMGLLVRTRSIGSNGQVAAITDSNYDRAGRPACTASRMNSGAFESLPANACFLGTAGAHGPDRISRKFHDAAGQLTKEQKAYGTALVQDYVSYTYSQNGQQISVTDANSNRADLRYDGHDRQSHWFFPSKSATGQTDYSDYEQYGYDENGNRTTFRKRDGSTLTYHYDALNRLVVKVVPERQNLPAAHTRDVHYEYDLRGLQTAARFDGPSGEGVFMGYDGFGRLTGSATVMGGFGRTLLFQHDPNGSRTRLTWPGSDAYHSFEVDDVGRLTGVRENGGALIAAFTHDSAGRPAARAAAGTATQYGYNPAGRLASLGHDLGGTGSDHSLGFAYNPGGQIVSRMASNPAYSSNTAYNVNRAYGVNGLNQYVVAGPASFSYDPNGNLTSDGGTTYLYDVENRLVSASGAQSVSLVYDPVGRLHQISGGSSGTIQFHYDGDKLVGEYDSGGALLRRYVHASSADSPIVWYEGGGLNQRRSLHADHQRSIVAVTDASGNAVAVNAYDSWGIPNANPVGRFGYTGQSWIPDLGMYHYKARIYSPTLGRFLQTDPIGYKDKVNLYAYVRNDPMNLADPTGTEVTAVFYADAGVVRMRDNDSGEERWAAAFSGGTSGGFQGGPIPGGNYAILEGASSNSYRLERYDSNFGNDRTPENRTELRFHPTGTRSIGCITCHPGKGGRSVGELLENTSTGSATVEYRGRIPFRRTEEVNKYGDMQVSWGSNIRFDQNSMRVSRHYPRAGNSPARTQYMCTIQADGRCVR